MNTEQLEHELRDALAARADALPMTAGSRVRAHAYRPRTRGLRPPVAAGALTAAAVAGAAVWVVAFSSQTSSAFAGWTATPTAGSPGQVSAAEAACRQRLTSAAPPGAQTGGDLPPAGGPDLSKLQPVLTDTRGPFTWAIFSGGNANASCISGPSFTMASVSGGVAVTAVPGRVALSSSSQAQTSSGAAYSFAEGRTGDGVTAATLVLDNGKHVQATLENGWFVAWWPGHESASSALVTTSAGTTTQALPAHAGPACPTAPKPGRGLTTCNSVTHAGGHGAPSLGFGQVTSSGSGGAGGAGSTRTQTSSR
jgi:hypothetical protein